MSGYKDNTKNKERSEDLSKNHGKKFRYRLRRVQEEEAEEEIKEFKEPDANTEIQE